MVSETKLTIRRDDGARVGALEKTARVKVVPRVSPMERTMAELKRLSKWVRVNR